MKNLKKYAIAALAGIGAARVLCWLNDGLVALLLLSNSGWTAEAAGKAAPWILFALISGLAISLTGLLDDNKRYSRSGYGSVEGFSARQKSEQNDKEMGA